MAALSGNIDSFAGLNDRPVREEKQQMERGRGLPVSGEGMGEYSKSEETPRGVESGHVRDYNRPESVAQ